MGLTCSTHEGVRNSYKIVVEKSREYTTLET